MISQVAALEASRDPATFGDTSQADVEAALAASALEASRAPPDTSQADLEAALAASAREASFAPRASDFEAALAASARESSFAPPPPRSEDDALAAALAASLHEHAAPPARAGDEDAALEAARAPARDPNHWVGMTPDCAKISLFADTPDPRRAQRNPAS